MKLFDLTSRIVTLAYSQHDAGYVKTQLEELSKESNRPIIFVEQLYTALTAAREAKQNPEVANAKGWLDDEIRVMMYIMEEVSKDKFPVKQAFAEMEHVLFKDKTAIWTQYYVIKTKCKDKSLEEYLADRKKTKARKNAKSKRTGTNTKAEKETTKTKQTKERHIDSDFENVKEQIPVAFAPIEPTVAPVQEDVLSVAANEELPTVALEEVQPVDFEKNEPIIEETYELEEYQAYAEVPAVQPRGEDLLSMLSGFVKNMQMLQPRLSEDSSKSSTVLDMFRGLYQLSTEAVAAAASEQDKKKYEQTLRESEEEKRMMLEQWEKERTDLTVMMQKKIENLSEEHNDTKQKLINLVRTVQQFEEGSQEEALINLPTFLSSVRYQLDKMGYRSRKRTTVKLDKQNMVTRVL